MPRQSPADTALCVLDAQYADFTANPLFGAALKEAERQALHATTATQARDPYEFGFAAGLAAGLRSLNAVVQAAHASRAHEIQMENAHADTASDSGDDPEEGHGGGDGRAETSYARLARRMRRSRVAVPVDEGGGPLPPL